MKIFAPIAVFLLASSASAFTPLSPISGSHNAIMTQIASATTEEYYIDDQRRMVMNLLMVGTGGLTVVGFGLPFVLFFFPPGAGSATAGPAKDILGNDIMAKEYLASKPAYDRSLVLGLNGDATYLIVKDNKTLESYALNAICTHLGCIVPWSALNNKFMCPCHGSQYSPDGAVVRGPAPLPLALAHSQVEKDGKILLSPWVEDDFRTGGKGWWN